MVLSVVVYFISKMNWKLGTIVNFLVGLFSMFYVFTLKIGFSETIVLFGQKLYFEWTDVSFTSRWSVSW